MQENAIIHEKYEWSNIWWDNANDLTLRRVLLIGDSISVGYSQPVTDSLQGKVYVDRLSNSRSLNDPALLKEICYMLSENKYFAIHFNNGLHGFHLPNDIYAQHLHHLLQVLQLYKGDANLIWASSTPVTVSGDPTRFDDEINALVIGRNTLAAQIMEEAGVPVNDLYGLVANRAELSSGDGYHYNDEGYKVLGEAVSQALLRFLI